MVKSDFIQILEDSSIVKQLNTRDLKTIIEDYPYFQSAHALYLKALKTQESFRYNNKLKVTAAYTTDRTVLFDFITSQVFTEHEQITESKPVTVSEKVLEEINETDSEVIQQAKQDLEIGKPLEFNKSEKHSFQQWLELSAKKPISRHEKEVEIDEKSEIIERFIASNPKISKLDKNSANEIKIVEKNTYPQLMTETLAKVYLEQKKYDNAIKAYEILSLKYPEKSGFFADQIKQVRILQKK